MGRVAGVLDDPPGFPYTPPGVDVLEGGKLTSNNVVGICLHENPNTFLYPIRLHVQHPQLSPHFRG